MNSKNFFQLILVCAVFVLGGCATSYQQAKFEGGSGFSDKQIAPARYAIQFQSNGHSESFQSVVYALRRAAELAKKDGKSGFSILNGQSLVRVTTYTSFIGGVPSSSTARFPKATLEIEVGDSPIHMDGKKKSYFKVEEVLLLTEPFVKDPKGILTNSEELNKRLETYRTTNDPQLLSDLYKSLIVPLKSEDARLQFRIGFLAGLFKDTATAEEWVKRPYLPHAKVIMAVALSEAGQDKLAQTMEIDELDKLQDKKRVPPSKMSNGFLKGYIAATGETKHLEDKKREGAMTLVELVKKATTSGDYKDFFNSNGNVTRLLGTVHGLIEKTPEDNLRFTEMVAQEAKKQGVDVFKNVQIEQFGFINAKGDIKYNIVMQEGAKAETASPYVLVAKANQPVTVGIYVKHTGVDKVDAYYKFYGIKGLDDKIGDGSFKLTEGKNGTAVRIPLTLTGRVLDKPGIYQMNVQLLSKDLTNDINFYILVMP